MPSLWEQFWDILWNCFVHAVSLQWGLLAQDGYDLRAWWDSFWSVVEVRLQDLWGALSNLGDYVSESLNQLFVWVNDSFADFGSFLGEQLDQIDQGLRGTISNLVEMADAWMYNAYWWLLDFAQWVLSLAWDLISPYFTSVADWVMEHFGWVLEYYTLITNWLVSVRDVITWLAAEAWTLLQEFLADPIAFVLGILFAPFVNILNWWALWGQELADFVAGELPGLRNLLVIGLTFLQTFVDNPLQTILDLLYPVFLDWLEQLIAENW